jgi:hypothetical protein
MARKPPKARQGRTRRQAPRADAASTSDRVTYRELRNTPGQVWERLTLDRPLTLVADGRPRALLIPIVDGDAAGAQEAYLRGRALIAVRRIQDAARRSGASAMSLDDINRLIADVRRELGEGEPSPE